MNIDTRPQTIDLDEITRRETAFGSFQELVDAPAYWPTLNMRKKGLKALADAYDAFQADRGDRRRANRISC